MTDNISPPGAAQYHSNTMNVGDGTWDSSRNSFLLPNLQGLNFETMRYNGMGNRFKGLPEYHTLILGHGVLAAITFIGIVPTAIFLAKYGRAFPRVSFKLHVYLQILTLILSTVILILGWFAVGPERSLTNPHHGIGVAIYVLIWWQMIFGCLMFRHERRRAHFPSKLPFAVHIHKLQGRAIALLGFVQIALGLTLYGSPKTLFILYALIGFVLLTAYLALEYHYKPRVGAGPQRSEYSDYGSSYVSDSRIDGRPPQRREDHGLIEGALLGAGAVGAAEWFKRRRERRQEERDRRYEERMSSEQRPLSGPPPAGPYGPPPPGPYGPPPPRGQTPGPMGPPPIGPPVGAAAIGAQRPPHSRDESRQSWEDEKYSEPPRHTWRDRILGATGAFAAYEGARSLFSRRRRRDDYSDDGRYTASSVQNQNRVSRQDVSRVEAGEAPDSPATPRVNMGGVPPMTPSETPSRPPRQGQMATEMSYESRDYQDLTLRDSIAEYGPLNGFREWNRARRARREADRAEMIRRQQLDSEQDYNRRNSNNYPRPQDASHAQSMSGTVLTGPSGVDGTVQRGDESRSNLRPDTSHPPLPAEAGTLPSSSHYAGSRQNIVTEQGYTIPPPPPGRPPNAVRPDGYDPPQFGSAQMPEAAVTPDPARLLSENTAANEASAYGRDPPVRNAPIAADVAAAAASRDTLSPSRPSGSRSRLQKRESNLSASASNVAGPSSGAPDNATSPPTSVKLHMRNDGRTITVRRLPEEEAAEARAARRQARQDRRPRRGSSLSSGGENDTAQGSRYRRNGGPIRRSSDQPIANVPPPPPMSSSAGLSQRRDSELNLPPGPPAVPQHSVSPGSNQGLSSQPAESGFGSPGDAGTGTDVSAFADNRRRRRAERARQQAERGGGGNRVEFEY